MFLHAFRIFQRFLKGNGKTKSVLHPDFSSCIRASHNYNMLGGERPELHGGLGLCDH